MGRAAAPRHCLVYSLAYNIKSSSYYIPISTILQSCYYSYPLRPPADDGVFLPSLPWYMIPCIYSIHRIFRSSFNYLSFWVSDSACNHLNRHLLPELLAARSVEWTAISGNKARKWGCCTYFSSALTYTYSYREYSLAFPDP